MKFDDFLKVFEWFPFFFLENCSENEKKQTIAECEMIDQQN